MATVRKRGARWYVKYKDERGRRRELPTRARSKTEARRLGDDLEGRAERVRLGLDPGEPPAMTFAEFAERWTTQVAARRRGRASIESRLNCHLLPAFGQMLLSEMTTERIERLLAEKSKTLGACSVEHLRRQMRAMLNCAIRWQLLRGPNAASAVPALTIGRRPTTYLEAEEIAPLLRVLSRRWYGLFATAVYAGLRKGELAGLRWEDVDLTRRLVRVARSYDAETKTARIRYIPICDELLAILEQERDQRRGSLVFPMPDGAMMPRHERVDEVMRRALKRALIVEGFDHKCRRKGCGYIERRADDQESRCPRCSMKLWVKLVPKRIRFHDLRSTFATHLRERTGDIEFVQKCLGHSTPALTASVYSAVRDRYAAERINVLRFGVTRPDSAPVCGNRVANGGEAVPRVYMPSKKTEASRELPMVRVAGVEPAAFGSGGHPGELGQHSSASQPVASLRESTSDAFPTFAPFCPVSPPVWGNGGANPRPLVPAANAPRSELLTVREVASRLRVSTATVYRLIERGRLPALRYAGSFLRVPAENLDRLAEPARRERRP